MTQLPQALSISQKKSKIVVDLELEESYFLNLKLNFLLRSPFSLRCGVDSIFLCSKKGVRMLYYIVVTTFSPLLVLAESYPLCITRVLIFDHSRGYIYYCINDSIRIKFGIFDLALRLNTHNLTQKTASPVSL